MTGSLLAQTPSELRWEYAWTFDNAQYQLVSAEIVRYRIGGEGKLHWFAGFGPAVGTRITGNVPVYGVFGGARAEYSSGGASVYAGLSGYGFLEQSGPQVGRAAFVAGLAVRF